MRRVYLGALVTALIVTLGVAAAGLRADGIKRSKRKPRTRSFEFSYKATILAVKGKTLDVWLPYPKSDEWQRIELVSITSPWEGRIHEEPIYRNRIYHVRTEDPGPGPHTITMTFRVDRKEKIRKDFAGRGGSQLGPNARKAVGRFLESNRLVPISGSPLDEILPGIAPREKNEIKVGRAIYDYVMDSMRYAKEGSGWGNGSTAWACDARYGNCTDFHALFISLARARGIPARFVIGFPLPTRRGEGKIGGYHCWADFYVTGYGWVPVDISEADKQPKLAEYYFGAHSEDRVEFTQGRDLVLAPPQKGPPLNFFVYPYAEVDGAPHGAIEKSFTFEDLP